MAYLYILLIVLLNYNVGYMERKEIAMEILHNVDFATYLHTKFQKCLSFHRIQILSGQTVSQNSSGYGICVRYKRVS